jgi:hypothetical protein
MSTIQIDRSADLRQLREKGYNIGVTGDGFLVVREVPYVNSRREIARGILASSLDLAGDVTVQPKDHTVKFVGDYPCDIHGAELSGLRHQSGSYPIGDGLVAQHSFSRNPGRAYENYFEKMTAYVALLAKHVATIDPEITALTRRVIEPEEGSDSPFNYLDTASSRADINGITAKLGQDAVAIVGLGGTGSYVLDLLAKTPIRKIHLFDPDHFLTHNAFRAPGAPTLEELRRQSHKVDHFKTRYSPMHRGIEAHPVAIDASNVGELDSMSFVFLCMEGGPAKRAIVERLEANGIPFIDVGMGLYAKRNKLAGMLRTVVSLPGARQAATNRISFAADDPHNDYDKNIQVADLNALNACFAVIAWKKYREFYFDMGHERFTSYTIANSLLCKGDLAE